MQEAELWLLAQKHEKQKEEEERYASPVLRKSWKPPPTGWVKCNIGIDFDKTSSRSGGAWVLRNEKGKILIHSRRVFYGVCSRDEANLQGLLWALESLRDHHINRVIIAMEDGTLLKVILRPKAWPNFRSQYCELEKKLRSLEWWRIEKEDRSTNRGAFLIAQSAAKGGYLQSYVASGGPQWLRFLFENEEVPPSL